MANKGQLKFLSTLSALSKEDRYCDIQIEFTNGSRRFNSLFLGALSPFFDAMLSSAMQEGLSGVVSLPTVNSEVFESVLDYYVNGVGDLDTGALYECIDASEMMQMTDLKQICIQNMKEKLAPENCLRVLQASRKYTSDKALESRAFEMICDNFRTVHKQEGFLDLDREDVLRLVRMKYLSKESDLFEALLSWIEANAPDDANAVEMFKEIRLELVEQEYILEKICKDGLLKYKTIETLMKQHLLKNWKLTTSENQDPSENVDVIVVCSTSAEEFNVHAWSIKQRKWFDLSLKPQFSALTQYAAAFAGQKIVISGGLRERVVSDTHIFDVLDNAWRIGPQLVYARYKHSCVSLHNAVYAVGGCTAVLTEEKGLGNVTYLNSIEEWLPCTNRWTVVGNLIQAVADAAVVRTGHSILVVGGDGGWQDGSGTVQCFNIQTMCCYKVGCIQASKYLRADILAQNLYVVHPYSVAMFQIKTEELTSVDSVKNCIKIKSISTDESFYSKHAVVVTEDTVYLYTDKFTRGMHFTDKGVKSVTLPTVPGYVEAVHCAFRARIASRCLLPH